MKVCLLGKIDHYKGKWDNTHSWFNQENELIIDLYTALSKDHQVTVYADPINPNDDWKDIEDYYITCERYDLCILMFRGNFKIAKLKCDKVGIVVNYELIDNFSDFDVVYVFNDYLKNKINHPNVKMWIYGKPKEVVEKIPLSIGYFSDLGDVYIPNNVFKLINEKYPNTSLYLRNYTSSLKDNDEQLKKMSIVLYADNNTLTRSVVAKIKAYDCDVVYYQLSYNNWIFEGNEPIKIDRTTDEVVKDMAERVIKLIESKNHIKYDAVVSSYEL